MRQMKKKIIIAIIVTLLLTAGIAFLISHFVVKAKDEKIQQLQAQVVDTKCIAFANDLKADSIITQDDLKEVEIKLSSIASGSYKVKDASNLVHYIEFLDENGNKKTSETPLKKQDLVGRVVKANVSKNTLILDSLLYPKDEEPTKDERLQEFNFLLLPSDLVENDYIDVRIQFPTGEDYSVLIGKKVEKLAGENTIFIKLNEEEIMAVGSAIIEAYMQKGVRLYANKYTDPATQLFDEAIVDYVAKYDYAVKRLTKEKEAKELRKEIATVLLNDAEASIDAEGYISYVTKTDVKENDMVTIAAGSPIRIPTVTEYEKKMDENGDTEDVTIILITTDALNMIPEEVREGAQGKIKEISVEDFMTEDIAIYAGIEEEYVDEIRLAQAKNDEDVLNYYKVMRVTTRDEIIRTYPVRQEVLNVIRNNPNLLDTVIAEFDTTALLNTRVDEYNKLKAEYEAEYDPYTKEEIKQKMEELANERVDNVEESLKKEIEAQRAERVTYLESLING